MNRLLEAINQVYFFIFWEVISNVTSVMWEVIPGDQDIMIFASAVSAWSMLLGAS